MLSYNQIQEAIEKEGRRIGQLAEECADIADTAADAEATVKLDFAKARIRIGDDAAAVGKKVTMAVLEDAATVETIESRRAHLRASASLTAIKEALKASEARLRGLQTLASGYRAAGG